MTPRPTITPGQVWRRPNGLHVLVTAVRVDAAERQHARLLPVRNGWGWWWRDWDRDEKDTPVSRIGGGKWQLVAEGVRDPRSTP